VGYSVRTSRLLDLSRITRIEALLGTTFQKITPRAICRPQSHGMTETMGRMRLRGLRLEINWDTQFAGSSSVPAHVEMMGFLASVTTQW